MSPIAVWKTFVGPKVCPAEIAPIPFLRERRSLLNRCASTDGCQSCGKAGHGNQAGLGTGKVSTRRPNGPIPDGMTKANVKSGIGPLGLRESTPLGTQACDGDGSFRGKAAISVFGLGYRVTPRCGWESLPRTTFNLPKSFALAPPGQHIENDRVRISPFAPRPSRSPDWHAGYGLPRWDLVAVLRTARCTPCPRVSWAWR